jgi:hypothetical protein
MGWYPNVIPTAIILVRIDLMDSHIPPANAGITEIAPDEIGGIDYEI